MSSYGREFGWLEAILADPPRPLEAGRVDDRRPRTPAKGGGLRVRDRLPPGDLFIDRLARARDRGGAARRVRGPAARPVDTRALRCLHANRDARRFYERHG